MRRLKSRPLTSGGWSGMPGEDVDPASVADLEDAEAFRPDEGLVRRITQSGPQRMNARQISSASIFDSDAPERVVLVDRILQWHADRARAVESRARVLGQ
jgi:hypothetical protein